MRCEDDSDKNKTEVIPGRRKHSRFTDMCNLLVNDCSTQFQDLLFPTIDTLFILVSVNFESLNKVVLRKILCSVIVASAL